MSDKPLCPYCGPWNGHPDGVELKLHEKKRHYRYDSYYYFCPVCYNGSPNRSSKEEALAAALRRFQPMQKPLTIKEIRELPDKNDFDTPPYLWIETRESIHGTLYNHWFHVTSLLEACRITISKWPHPFTRYEYGVDFRAWWNRPVACDEETAQAEKGVML